MSATDQVMDVSVVTGIIVRWLVKLALLPSRLVYDPCELESDREVETLWANICFTLPDGNFLIWDPQLQLGQSSLPPATLGPITIADYLDKLSAWDDWIIAGLNNSFAQIPFTWEFRWDRIEDYVQGYFDDTSETEIDGDMEIPIIFKIQDEPSQVDLSLDMLFPPDMLEQLLKELGAEQSTA